MAVQLHLLVVDDEPAARMGLRQMLLTYCSGVHRVDMADSTTQARPLLQAHTYHGVFLDTSMPGEDGFELLPYTGNARVIFTTAYSQYAIKAVKSQAFDYILKPVDIDELTGCVGKILAEVEAVSQSTAAAGSETTGRIRVPLSNGSRFIDISDILYLQADGNYTTLYLRQGDSVIVAKLLKDFEEQLPGRLFLRIHKSIVVNLACVTGISHAGGMQVHLGAHIQLPVSRRRVQAVNDALPASHPHTSFRA